MIVNQKYRLYWIFRFFFPCLFFSLFFTDISRYLIFSAEFDLTSIILFPMECYLFYHMLYFFTVEYEITVNKLIVYSFWFRRKIYYTKDILQVREEGNYYLFRKVPFGINTITIDWKNGKNDIILGLKKHYSFLQHLQYVRNN